MRANRRRASESIRTLPTRRGVRILQNGTVLSEVLARPGPTHSVVDVMAAAVCALSNGSRTALLGFEGGGFLAPLRAMKSTHTIDAVDISDRSVRVFDNLCRSWCGDVAFHRADAEDWLRKSSGKFDVIVEDISVSSGHNVVQPELVYSTLPCLIRRRLRTRGLAVLNMLRPQNGTWSSLISRIASEFANVQVVLFAEYENRVFLAGADRIPARSVSAQLRAELRKIGSRLATRISVRSISGIGREQTKF